MPDLPTLIIAVLIGAALLYWAGLTMIIIREVVRDTETESVFESISVAWRVLWIAMLIAFICMLLPSKYSTFHQVAER